MSNSFNQKPNEDSVSVMAVNMVGNCMPYRQEQTPPNVLNIDTHWTDGESMPAAELGSVYQNENMMKQYAQSQSVISGRLSMGSRLTDRERLQLHNELSWKEASEQDVIVVRCREMSAELHKSRLGSGSKGKCIKMGDAWLTPSEFESIAGRGSSKDWKRSIRFGGHTLQKLIEEGILAPHAIACTCAICCGESHLGSGPVRLFTPYKRKRKDMNSSVNSIGMSFSGPMGHNGSVSFNQIEEIVTAMVNASQNLKMMVDQMRMHFEGVRETSINQLRVQAELDKRDALLQQRNEITGILRRCLPVEQEVIIQQVLTQVQGETAVVKSCASCGRDAFLECTACRRACYCSTYCQQRDWPVHQHQCALVQNTESMVASSNIAGHVDDSAVDGQTTTDDGGNQNC